MKRSQRKLIGAIAIAGVLIVVASAGIWAIFLSSDAPDPVSLQEAVASLETPTAQRDGPVATNVSTAEAGTEDESTAESMPAAAGDDEAIWNVVAG